MIKLSIFYPNIEGKKFDKDYYINTHMPLSMKLQGSAIRSVNVDFGISGLPGTKAPYIAICHFIYDSFQAFEAAFTPHADVLMKDIKNYTDIETIIQFSEVKI
ncbi:MAG TPA: EthD family reductase [Chitinophagaceae bacterium]|jgi:uncharacterized protein (TIGR02118 family)|nr:EthD family reductase [Chitinophagaceae bacterium]